MGLDIVVDWQDSTLLGHLASFSSRAVDKLGVFLLANKRERGFDEACQEMKEVFGSLYETGKLPSSNPEWYEHTIILTHLYRNFGEREEGPEQLRARLISEVEKVERARDIKEAECSVRYLRDKFFELSGHCRADLREMSHNRYTHTHLDE